VGDQNEGYAGAVDVASQITQESRATERDVGEGRTNTSREFAGVEEPITTVFECFMSVSGQFLAKMTYRLWSETSRISISKKN
jgi:hypothetical protein